METVILSLCRSFEHCTLKYFEFSSWPLFLYEFYCAQNGMPAGVEIGDIEVYPCAISMEFNSASVVDVSSSKV